MSQSPEKPLSPEQLEAAAGGLRLTGDVLRPQDSGRDDSELSVEQLKKAQGGLRLTGDVLRPQDSGRDDSELSIEQLEKAHGGSIPVRPPSRERSQGGEPE